MIVSLGEATGIQPTNADNKAQLIRYLNTAGREIWSARDLPGSTFEQFFQVPLNTITADKPAIVYLTLPWYCEGIRGVRWSQVGQKIQLQDMRPRYQATPWYQPFLTWRVKETIPLSSPLTADGALTFTMSASQAQAVIVTIIGSTATASSAYEQVVMLPGALTVTTTVPWTSVKKITKNIPCTCDIAITDINGADVGIIPSRQEAAANLLIQIADDYAPVAFVADGVIEVLYKMPYQELAFDGDTFLNKAYEDALIWRARANWAALQSNEVLVAQAAAFAQKSDNLLSQLTANQEASVEMQMQFAPNRYYDVLSYARYGRRTALARYGRR